jgi:hypothetical protein
MIRTRVLERTGRQRRARDGGKVNQGQLRLRMRPFLSTIRRPRHRHALLPVGWLGLAGCGDAAVFLLHRFVCSYSRTQLGSMEEDLNAKTLTYSGG